MMVAQYRCYLVELPGTGLVYSVLPNSGPLEASSADRH